MKLKLQYFGHTTQTANSLEKTLVLGKIEGRRMEREKMRWLDGSTNTVSLRKLRETVKDREAWYAAVHRVANNWKNLVTEQQQQQIK